MEAVQGLGDALRQTWHRFGACFRTKTRDGGLYAYHYLCGLLRMTEERNFATIGRQAGLAEQNVQHVMSNSPWSAQPVFQQVQREIATKPGLESGGMLLLDESADDKAGLKSVGAARQYNGRMGKVELSQVGVFLAYSKIQPTLPAPVWTWVDGEVFLPEHWFSAEMAGERRRLEVPTDRVFATKVELGWQMIVRAQANGLPFEAVCCDDLYGRSTWFRRNAAQAGLVYVADVPSNTQVYLAAPTLGVPLGGGARAKGTTAQPHPGALGGEIDPGAGAVWAWGHGAPARGGALDRARRDRRRVRGAARLDGSG